MKTADIHYSTDVSQESRKTAELNFVRQQGFEDASPEACVHQYPALMLQPRVTGILILIGLVLQAVLSRFIGAALVERGLAEAESL